MSGTNKDRYSAQGTKNADGWRDIVSQPRCERHILSRRMIHIMVTQTVTYCPNGRDPLMVATASFPCLFFFYWNNPLFLSSYSCCPCLASAKVPLPYTPLTHPTHSARTYAYTYANIIKYNITCSISQYHYYTAPLHLLLFPFTLTSFLQLQCDNPLRRVCRRLPISWSLDRSTT